MYLEFYDNELEFCRTIIFESEINFFFTSGFSHEKFILKIPSITEEKYFILRHFDDTVFGWPEICKFQGDTSEV
jgi:hypothetical protein